MGQQADALDDYDRAVSLDDKFAEALHARYETSRPLPQAQANIFLDRPRTQNQLSGHNR